MMNFMAEDEEDPPPHSLPSIGPFITSIRADLMRLYTGIPEGELYLRLSAEQMCL